MYLFSLNNGKKVLFLIIVGDGLVGSSIIEQIKIRGYSKVFYVKPNWFVTAKIAKQLLLLMKKIGESKSVESVSLIWSAGKTGFNSSLQEVQSETLIFKQLIQVFMENIKTYTDSQPIIHYMSSAGGLYEGIRNVDTSTIPMPKRPYGFAKLEQENFLKSYLPQINLHIYRPSSVYGFINAKNRLGLISALIINTINHRTTIIAGGFDTLRDYIWVGNVASFVTDMIDSNSNGSFTHLLANGRAYSIYEIKNTIEKRLRRKVYLKFSKLPSNANHNTYLKKTIANKLKNNSLEEMVNQVVNKYIS